MNKKLKFICLTLKNNSLPFIFFIFLICLIIFSKSNMFAVKNGLNIWINNVIPSLLPFFIATELLNYTNIPKLIGNLFNKVMRPLFNVPGIGAYTFFMGIISGYPIGAKIVTNFRNNNLCSKAEAERLLTFTNNSGPLFILGTVGISLFYDTSIGILLLLTHMLSCITVGIIFRFWKYNEFKNRNYNNVETNISFNSLGEILTKSITSAINSVVLIGGFIIIFNIIISILNKIYILNLFCFLLAPCFSLLNIKIDFIIPIISGIIELTNGVSLVSLVISKNIGINIIICSFLLGFGGISIMLQVLGIISKSDISIKPYIIGKILHGTFAAVYTSIIISNFSYFNYLKI